MADALASRPLRVYTLPPIWGTPSPSPFAIKLLTWLRMVGLPYETPPLLGPPRSHTGKIPYVVLPDNSVLADSGLIIEALGARYGRDLDEGLSEQARALGHTVRRMVEEHLYWVGVYERWVTDVGFAATARDYFSHLPPGVRWILPRYVRPSIRRYLHGHGLGRHEHAQIVAAGRRDVETLAALLGDQPYLVGRLSTVDATLYGFLAAFLAHPFDSPVSDAVRAHPNLVAYRDRLTARWWAAAGDVPT